MTQNEKAEAYDNYVRMATVLQNENSRLKSMEVINMSEETKKIIDANNHKLNELERKMKELFY